MFDFGIDEQESQPWFYGFIEYGSFQVAELKGQGCNVLDELRDCGWNGMEQLSWCLGRFLFCTSPGESATTVHRATVQ